MKPASEPLSESHPMNGGDGSFSYSKNSYFQKLATSAAQDIIKETISEKLEVTKLCPNSTTFKIVDMGCSIGPNTFVAVQNIIQAVQTNYSPNSSLPDFQVFFNDHVSNDFNTLFASLPSQSDRRYYAAGVPGSFHSRLFPDSSLHIVHSSYALHWLSKVPEPVLDRNSPAWNKGRVHYTGGSADEVREAYRVQFMEDMGVFMRARGEEIVSGGLMVIVMPGISDGGPCSRGAFSFTFNLLDLALMDLVVEGAISEEKVDSFNFPVYAASPSDMRKLVEANGCFTVERLQLILPGSNITQSISAEAITMHFRAGMEGIITKHFGPEIIHPLFDRYLKNAEENSSLLNSRAKESSQLLAILKRK